MRVLIALVAAVATPLPALTAGSPALDACDARVRASPGDPLSYYCYLEAVRAGAPRDDAVRRLEEILSIDRGRHRALLILGMLVSGRRNTEAESLLREAVDGMEADDDHHGVVYGALSLSFLLGQAGRLVEAESMLNRAVAAAEASGDRDLRANVWAEQALLARRRADYDRSLHLYRQARTAVFPDGPAWLRANVLNGIGWLEWYFGDLRAAMATYRSEAEIREAELGGEGAPAARFNLAFLAMALVDRGEYPRGECEPLIEEALEAAIETRDPASEGHARLLRARILPAGPAAEECRRAIELARRAGDVSLKWNAMGELASRELEIDASNDGQAFALVDTVITEARRAGIPHEVSYALQRRAELATRAWPRDEALAAWEVCLDTVESVGARQQEDLARAYTLSHWSEPYHRAIDLLLEGPAGSAPRDADLEKAFRTMERRRARSLRVTLAHRGVVPPGRPGNRYPTLDEVRGALGEREVMLVYDVTVASDGASWLFVITRDGVELRRLPGSRTLDDAISVFEGLVRSEDSLVARAAADLAATVLGGSLGEETDLFDTILLIPDGPLHRLPFAALRERPDAEPLGTRVRIDVVPSVALWMAWGEEAPRRGANGVLSLADPDPSVRAAGSFRDARATPSRLPNAREEARGIARALGGNNRVLAGREASEWALKNADLASFRLLHLAAHAVVDDAHPERSAVLLAPGSEHEDGMLRLDEIAALDLDDQVVLLSACRGASGPVVGGEGILGLARAFLQAGARAVLANRWPYRDDHAAALTLAISRELGRGSRLGEALTAARRARAASGAPLGSWAGVTLIGDGTITLAERGGSFGIVAAWVLIAAAAALGVKSSFVVLRTKRKTKT